MSTSLCTNLALVAALLGGSSRAGRQRRPLTRSTRTTPPTAPPRPSSCCFGAGARGTALGGAFSAIATDVSALYYNPAGIALMPRAGAMVGTYDYVADTRYSWGGIAFPFCRRLAGRRHSDRHLRLQGPAGLHGRAARRHRLGLLGQRNLRRPHLCPELLRPVLRRRHRPRA